MKRADKKITLPFVELQQGGKKMLLTYMTAAVLVKITYVAVRRQDTEEGAVQRPLSENRIGKIRDFILNGGDFPACIILNWTNPELLKVVDTTLEITLGDRAAQIIDGQHRVAGLEEAIVFKKPVKDMELPVAIFQQLTTQQCADIFLSINTEQKPAPPSLAYDLFGVASKHVIDIAALRAADIAKELNENEDSPYNGLVKYVGDQKKRGPAGKLGIALSTFVNAIKPLVEEKGVFDTMGVRDFVKQTQAIVRFLNVLYEWYGEDEWLNRNNAFMHAAGFTGAIEFLKVKLIPYCNGKRSYKYEIMRDAFNLDPSKRIHKQELTKMQGRASARKVTELLVEQFHPAKEQEQELEF
jgi:DNA sulfur modification protein DndB